MSLSDTEIQQLENLEGSLNQFLGDLLESQGIVSAELKELVGNIQALTIATVKTYDNGDSDTKTKIDKSGLLSDRKDKSGNVIGKQFNVGKLFGLAKDLNQDLNVEQRAESLTEKLKSIVTELDVTQEAIDEGQKVNDSRKGSNPSPDASLAVPIAPIYSAVDENLGDLGKQVVIAMQLAIRSGITRIPTGRENAQLAQKAYESNFAAGAFDRDPDHIKKIMAAAQKLNNFERGVEGAPEPTQEDFDAIKSGFATALEKTQEIKEKLDPRLNLDSFLENLNKLKALLDKLEPPKADPAPSKPGVGNKKAKNYEALRHEDQKAYEESLKNLFGEDWNAEVERFFKALMSAYGQSFTYPQHANEDYKNQILKLANTLKPEDGFESKTGQPITFTLSGQGDNSFIHKFAIDHSKIEFTDGNQTFGPLDAYNMALLASMDKDMLKDGIDLKGTRYERTLLALAVEKVNKMLPKDQQLKIKSGKTWLRGKDKKAEKDWEEKEPEITQPYEKRTEEADPKKEGGPADPKKEGGPADSMKVTRNDTVAPEQDQENPDTGDSVCPENPDQGGTGPHPTKGTQAGNESRSNAITPEIAELISERYGYSDASMSEEEISQHWDAFAPKLQKEYINERYSKLGSSLSDDIKQELLDTFQRQVNFKLTDRELGIIWENLNEHSREGLKQDASQSQNKPKPEAP